MCLRCVPRILPFLTGCSLVLPTALPPNSRFQILKLVSLTTLLNFQPDLPLDKEKTKQNKTVLIPEKVDQSKKIKNKNKKPNSCLGNFRPIPQVKILGKNYFLKTSANSITQFLTTTTDVQGEKKKNNQNQQQIKGIHLKNLDKQLELYKQILQQGEMVGGWGRGRKETGDRTC